MRLEFGRGFDFWRRRGCLISHGARGLVFDARLDRPRLQTGMMLGSCAPTATSIVVRTVIGIAALIAATIAAA